VFGLFKKRNRQAALEECARELERTRRAMPQFVASPRDMSERATLLNRANALELGDTPTVRCLDYLQKLLTIGPTLKDDDSATIDALVKEGVSLGLGDFRGVTALQDHQQLMRLQAHGPEPLERDLQGRAVFLRASAEHKNKEGVLEVRQDGLTFVGEVRLDIPWSDVTHAAGTSHSYRGNDYPAVALQERKRRTATKFAFPTGRNCDYQVAVIVAVWQRTQGR
jgi:hypothetical protein